MGPVGIEPTSSGLRDRCITLSATVPNQSARWELNPRPASYKDAALTVELRASESRAGGTRTHTCRIKSPVCCQLHHNPIAGWAYAFVASWQHFSSPRAFISVHWDFVIHDSGSPENRTQPGAVISRVWTTSPRLPRQSRAPRSRTETLLLPKQACFHLHLCPFVLSVRTAGFEPAIPWPPTRCDNQASPRSD